MNITHPAPRPARRPRARLLLQSSWRMSSILCGALRTMQGAAAWRRTRIVERRAARLAAGRQTCRTVALPAGRAPVALHDTRWIV